MAAAIHEGNIRFHVWPNDHPPPHVHVLVEGEEVRVNLLTDEFMDEPPPGKRRTILRAYRKHRQALLDLWKRYEAQR